MSGHAVFASWDLRDRLLRAWLDCQPIDRLSTSDSTGQGHDLQGPDGAATPPGRRIEIGVPDAGPGYGRQ
jgi:hypothetical protein